MLYTDGVGSPLVLAMVQPRLIGQGLYTVAEASRLTRVSQSRIRRWMRGYTFVRRGETGASPPVVHSDFGPIDDTLVLSFLDLQEIRFVDAFIGRGVSWQTLRLAAERAHQFVASDHPFATGKFWTDGRGVLVVLGRERDPQLLNIVSNQTAFKAIVGPYLSQLDFSETSEAERWWPLGKNRRVLLDPQRSFGQAIVKEGVPTLVLHRAVRAEGSEIRVARWYAVDEVSVGDAVEFEDRLAA